MKKTKLLTSLVALALVVGLGACETGDIIVNVGDVDIGGDSSDTTDTEPSEPSEPSSSDTGSTPSEPEDDSSSSSSTPEEPPVVTHEYSIEVENAEALKELTYDGNAATQQGVQLSIYLVDTPSEGTPTREAATENDVTFTVSDPTVVTVSGLTVLPLKEGSTSITIAWADKATTNVGVLVTDITVNEPVGPTSWADIITGDNGTEDYYDLLTALLGATIDDVLPFYYETEGNPSWYVTDTMFKLEYDPAPSGLSDVWFALLAADGWEQTDHTNNGWEDDTTYAKNGYTIKITLDGLNCWDLYLYPPEDTGEEGGDDNEDLETAQAILNAAAAQTNGFQDFEYVNVQARYSNGGGGAYEHYNFDLTTDNSNLFGREIRHDEDGDDETKFRTRYYYEKYYYDINNTSGANTHSGPTSNSNNGVNRVLGWRLTSSRNYDAAFDNASSIDLAGATDFELTTEANGNYKLTFIYNNTWYCYKATADCKLVGAGSAINWTSSTSYEIYYGEEESEGTFNALMEPFFDDEYWFPKEEEETEPTSWADIITGAGDYDKATALLGATLDEILPFYFVETGFQQYYVTDTRVDLYYGSEPSGLVDAWISILLEDGWTQGETVNSGYSLTYPFTKDGYTVELYSAFGSFDLYVYPKADTGEEEPTNPGSGSSTVVDSDNIEDALSLLLEYGADTSSWSGVAFQDVIDYSENMYGFLNIDLEKFDETILATEKDGVVTGLDEDLVYVYGELYADYSEYEYYDGTTLHSLDYGSYSSEETSLDLSYFTSYPLSQVQYDIAYLTQFSGLTTLYSYLGYEFDGGIKVSDDAITVTASVGAAQEYEDEDYGDCQETLTITLEVVYDLDGGLISSSFSYIDYIYYPSIYSSLTYSQTTTCSNFTGTIDTPTWVVNA